MTTYSGKVLGTVSVAGVMLLTVTACGSSPTEPDLNLASISGFQASPTLSGANALVIGILRGVRDNAAGETTELGTVAREGYGICQSCNSLSSQLILPLAAAAGGGGMYTLQYTDLREAYIVLSALHSVPGITAQQIAGITGFVQTMEAIDLTTLAFTRDTFGITIVPNPSPTGPPGPVAPKAVVYQHVLNLLDSGYTNLQNAGTSFTFTLDPGFTGFDTPATFAPVNRALRARVDLHLSNYAQVLTDLTTSFLSTSAPLSEGIILNFSTASSDEQTPLFNAYYRAETHYLDSAQLQANGQPDLRWTDKVSLTASLSYDGVTSPYRFASQLSATSPLPLIRNEELILMRAEANIGLGNVAAALPDINLVRQTSGGLAPLTLADLPTQAAALNELLYNKKYSLWWEDGIRWIDLKHYGLLGNLTATITGGRIFDIFPFVLADCNAFPSPKPLGCTETVVGIPGIPAGEGG